MYKVYRTRTILNVHKHCDGGWFWDKYSAFPYIGCEWGCEYCYWRDERYNPHRASRDLDVSRFRDPFSEYIKIKENAPELLRKELGNRQRDLIYLDNYQPIDSEYQYTRQMLEVCLDLGFPAFINEKSPMLMRDLDILRKLSRTSYLNVGWSIITATDDDVRGGFEHRAPPVSARFAAMKRLSEDNITTGTVFMPILPFIYDTEENIEAVVRRTQESGGNYVLDGGLTLWGYSRIHFYKALRGYDPSLISKYDDLYGDLGRLAEHTARVHELVKKYCEKYDLVPHITRPVSFHPAELRLNKRIAEQFYLMARELQLTSENRHKEWAYRKAAWALDDLQENVGNIHRKEGMNGLLKIDGIGKSLANQIEEYLNTSDDPDRLSAGKERGQPLH